MQHTVGSILRRVGRALEGAGVALQDKEAYIERRELFAGTLPPKNAPAPRGGARPAYLPLSVPAALPPPSSPFPPAVVPSTRVVAFRGKEAATGAQTFVASTVSARCARGGTRSWAAGVRKRALVHHLTPVRVHPACLHPLPHPPPLSLPLAHRLPAPQASLIGDVTLADGASAWYGATLRGDRAPVRVGKGAAVLDNASVSTTAAGGPASLGADATVCAGAHVQSARVGDGAMVGAGALVLPGASVGADSYVDAGAVVAAGTAVPSGQLWTGAPARFLRRLEADEMSFLRTSALRTAALAQAHAAQGALSVAEVEAQAAERLTRLEHSIPAEAPLATVDADVVQYYKLTAPKENSGLLRGAELNVAEELRLREAAELAADTAEEEFFNARARLRRIGEAVRTLAETRPDRPAERDGAIAALAARDPEGAAQLRGLLFRAAAAGPAQPAGEREDLLRSVAATDFEPHASAEDAKAAHEAALSALAAHARALTSAGGAAGGAGASFALPASGAAKPAAASAH